MIPRASLIAWSARAPWPSEDQVEQDLIISRLLVEIARDPLLSKELAFRGGTCLHKLHLEESLRYSEDLDFVRTNQQPLLGEVFDALRLIADRIGLREHRRKFPSENSDASRPGIDAEEIAAALHHYMQDRVYSYPQLVGHLKTKLGDIDFAADLRGLVRSVPDDYDIPTALELVRRRIGLKLRNVPEEPMPIEA